MKIINKLLLLSFVGFIFFSCSDDEEIISNPTDDFDVELAFSETSGDVTESVNVTPTDGTIKARVQVTSTTNMARLYITRNVGGTGDEPYTPADLSSQVTKPDGSIDVEADPNALDYTLNLDVPSGISEGNVVYKFWATSGRGDYRDPSKRFVAGVGSIELLYGGSNPAAELNSYSATILAAPLDDGSSETFISLLNGDLYKISEGTEYAAFWDFGYYYGATGLASLSSTYRYPHLFDHDNDNDPNDLVGIAILTDTPQEDLNHCYFTQSAKTTGDFDSFSVSGDLDYVSIAANDDLGRINQLEQGDIIDFVDNYGKKGIIRVVEISGTNGSNDFIKIDIKVQP